ncbi:hypothetical protein HLV40_15910 [Chromohalobacter salexigens]|nr:hypothetical protein [Chromohalobacter salexigens]
MSKEAYNIWNLLGTWLSGLATLAAVVVSLYLARQNNKPKIITSSYLEQITDAESVIEAELKLLAYNKGYRSLAIMDMKLIMGRTEKQELRIKALDEKQYESITKAIHPGETVALSFPMILDKQETETCRDLTDAISQVAIYISKREKSKLTPREIIGTLTLAIEAPDKECFSQPMDYSVIDFFQEHFNPSAREIESPT